MTVIDDDTTTLIIFFQGIPLKGTYDYLSNTV